MFGFQFLTKIPTSLEKVENALVNLSKGETIFESLSIILVVLSRFVILSRDKDPALPPTYLSPRAKSFINGATTLVCVVAAISRFLNILM